MAIAAPLIGAIRLPGMAHSAAGGSAGGSARGSTGARESAAGSADMAFPPTIFVPSRNMARDPILTLPGRKVPVPATPLSSLAIRMRMFRLGGNGMSVQMP
ncbi:hypothetical protein GCM10023205_00670 [Yinghuangia aomiensis]|uniref:Uncharacterized protein n=1 Tax=Yinghuangia aomiensis TaxID=676205 RepID=A0ABP9GIY2_9ACTN